MAIFVYPRWPSASILVFLDFIEPEIAPFDSSTPKTFAQNRTWSGSDAPFARYSLLNYTVYDLETGVRGQLRSSKLTPFDRAHIRLCIRGPTQDLGLEGPRGAAGAENMENMGWGGGGEMGLGTGCPSP